MFTKFADDTRLGETANRPAGRAAIHKDLEMPKEWARGNPIKFNKDRYKMLPVGRKHWCKDMPGWKQLCKKGYGGLPWLQHPQLCRKVCSQRILGRDYSPLAWLDNSANCIFLVERKEGYNLQLIQWGHDIFFLDLQSAKLWPSDCS